jgi:integrase
MENAMGKRRAKGEGSITYNRSKGKYQGSYLKPDGRRGYVYANSQREVSRLLADLRRRIDAKLDVTSARATVEAFLTHWLEENRPNWKAKTYRHNEVVCRLHIAPHIGNVKLDALDVPTIQRWLHKLRADHHSTDLPPRALGVLRTALNAAVAWRILDHNPAMLVQKPKHERRRGIALTPAQSAALLAQVAGHRLEALYYIALTLGLRQGELVNLRWASIDLDAAKLTIEEGKTPAAWRTLPLDPAMVDHLRRHWEAQCAERAALSLTWQEHGLVFPSEVGTRLIERNLYRHFERLRTQAGLPSDVIFHDLRHTALTRLAENGAPPAVVQAIAGHTTPGLALQVYTHTDLDALRAAFAR